MIAGLITPLASLLGTVVETQMVKQKSKQKILEDAATHDNKWELLMAKNMNNSWSDEIWTVAIVFIMFLCFVPFMQPYIQSGFQVLKNDTPEWFQYAVFASLAGSYGLKTLGKFKK